MAKLSGGGITSNKLVQARAPKVEPKAHAISPGAVSQLGSASIKGNDPLNAGRGYNAPVGPTDNVAAVGVGGGRTIHRSGSQSPTPKGE